MANLVISSSAYQIFTNILMIVILLKFTSKYTDLTILSHINFFKFCVCFHSVRYSIVTKITMLSAYAEASTYRAYHTAPFRYAKKIFRGVYFDQYCFFK